MNIEKKEEELKIVLEDLDDLRSQITSLKAKVFALETILIPKKMLMQQLILEIKIAKQNL